ncbi:MAG: CHAT domain-containing protein [Myxococcota bacterium]
MDILYGGCTQIWLERQPRCIFEPAAPLHLWVAHHDVDTLALQADGRRLTPLGEHTEDTGIGLEVKLPADAKVLTVETTAPETTAPRARWSLALRSTSEAPEPPPGIATNEAVDEALANAFMASEHGQYRSALHELSRIEADASRYPKGRADLATYRGLVHWKQGRFHDAATSLRQGVAFATKLHDDELIRDAVPIYAAALIELGYTDAAAYWTRWVLSVARDAPDRFDCLDMAKLLSTVGHVHRVLAGQRGRAPIDPRVPLREGLGRVEPGGPCPDPPSVPALRLSLAELALDRGDPSAALATLAPVRWDDVPSADQRFRLHDAELRARLAAGHSEVNLEDSLDQLRQAVDRAGSAQGRWRLALREGDVRARQARWEQALEAYAAAEREAQGLAELAAVGVGRQTAVTLHASSTERLVRLLNDRGRPADALCAAREAAARRIQAVGKGRRPGTHRGLDRAIDQYERASRRLDDARLHRRVRPREDQAALGQAVAQAEQQLAEVANEILRAQSTWRPSCDDLVPRASNELLLGLYPTPTGWLVFAQDNAGTQMRELSGGPDHALDDPALGEELLAPLDERLERANTVRILASKQAQDVDVHLLKWRGRPLIEHDKAVVYGAELPRVAAVTRRARSSDDPDDPDDPDDAPKVALLLADPTETLPLAPAEVQMAELWLTLQGWTTSVPTPATATPARIIAQLERASLFYFAGHGEHDEGAAPVRPWPPYAGGTRAWPARLRLLPPTVLEAQQIAMLPSAPRHVVLVGCETGVTRETGGGMSLALAFLIAGAEQVVATPAKVSDEVGRATGAGVLGELSGHRVDLARGLQRVQAKMLQKGQSVGRYRVWVR